ncbi:MAG: glutamine synthetase family protein [Candidatus Gracilibacteria bacterium]|jgi:glutamine synthetase
MQTTGEKKISTTAVSEKNLIAGHSREYGDFLKKQSIFVDYSYAELEEMNLKVKKERLSGVTEAEFEKRFLQYLRDEKGVKAVMVCFSDMEGKFHILDYDKKFLLNGVDNLTFDGSSIKGFTEQKESDLRLKIDWSTFKWVPADIFGAGKVLTFGYVCDKDGGPYQGDFRYNLANLCADLAKKGITVNVAPEIEGFLFKGENAEQTYDERVGFELATQSGYFNTLPQGTLRLFIDKFAEAQRALAFENEKDHPEVAPAQFELNYKYTEALYAADQIQLYKLLARQVARIMGFTACFLPKPISGMNGSGMHTNMSLSKNDKNIFFDAADVHKLSKDAYRFLTSILYYGNDLCLLMNPSVNAYRRLDPAFEAPNEIKVSAVDRGSMVRIPIGNERSARIEVRTVAPDANPYIYLFALIKAGLNGFEVSDEEMKAMEKVVYTGKAKKLPGDIYSAITLFEKSKFMEEIIGKRNKEVFTALKKKSADRAPRCLGAKVKAEEILYHHEVTNQMLWNDF